MKESNGTLKLIRLLITILVPIFGIAAWAITRYVEPVQADVVRIEKRLDEHIKDHPTKAYLNLQFGTIRDSIQELKEECKAKGR